MSLPLCTRCGEEPEISRLAPVPHSSYTATCGCPWLRGRIAVSGYSKEACAAAWIKAVEEKNPIRFWFDDLVAPSDEEFAAMIEAHRAKRKP